MEFNSTSIEIAMVLNEVNCTLHECESLLNKTKDGCHVRSPIPDPKSCKFIFDVYVTIFLCVVGIVGNSLTIAVLRRVPDKGNITNWLLQLLAIVDGSYLAFSLIFVSVQTLGVSTISTLKLRRFLHTVELYLWPMQPFMHTLTIWSVILVTIDRYLAICHPLRTQLRDSVRMKTCAVVGLILAIVYHIPLHFVLDVSVDETGSNVLCESRLARNIYFKIIHGFLCAIILKSVGPFLIVLVLNTLIVREIRAMNMKRLEMTRPVVEEKAISIVLCIVVVIFLLCQFPGFASDIAYDASHAFSFPLDTDAISCAFDVFNALEKLNSAMNFFIYCLIWKKFNRILKQMSNCREIENAESRSHQLTNV